MISTMSSGMMSSTNGYCYNKFGTESNGTAISSSNGTGTSPPFSISPSATTQFAYEQCHQQHYGCMHGPMSITAQGALERNSANNMTECVAVPTSEHVAEIVGKQGCKIKSLRDKTNTYIKTPMRGEEPIFVITGRLEDVEIAKCEIVQAAEHFTQIRAQRRLQPPAVPGQVSEKMQVPLRLVGLIVGPKGQTIKRIQQDTNTYIVTPGREKVPIFDITGPKDGVDTARNMIAEHILSRTGNTLEELLRQQAEQGIMGARPRSRSADEAAVANFDIGCWNVDPEPESDGDGSDSGMVMGSNGMPYRINDGNSHACSHAPRFASFSAASSSTPYDVSSSATMMPQKQQQQQYARPLNGMLSHQYNGSTNGYNSGSTNGIANGTGTLMSNNNRSFCLSSHANSNGCGNGSVLTRPAHAPAEHMCSAMNCNNKMRSTSFSAAGMGGGYVCGESSPEPQNHQQQLHLAAAAAAAVAGGRHSLQYSSMSEAFGGNNATLMSGTGSHVTGFHPQQPQQNNNGSLFHTHNNFRRLNSESQQFSAFASLGEYASNNGDPTERQQPSSARRFSQPFTSGHYYCQPQSVQRGGYDQQQAMQATTPTNLTSSVTSAANSINSFSTGFWSAAPTTTSSSAKTENGGGLFVMPDMDKMMSTLTLNDGGADGFANNNGSGKATSTSASSSSASSCGNNFWSGNGNIDNGGGLASSTSKLCMF